MLLTRWNPLAEVEAAERTMDRLLAEAFGSRPANGSTEPSYRQLPVDIEQTEAGYEITAPVPGFKPEDVEVTYLDGVLTIAAKRTEESTKTTRNYLSREVRTGNLFRQIAVGQGIDPAGISASFEDGMLSVTVPAPVQPAPHRIELGKGTPKKALKS